MTRNPSGSGQSRCVQKTSETAIEMPPCPSFGASRITCESQREFCEPCRSIDIGGRLRVRCRPAKLLATGAELSRRYSTASEASRRMRSLCVPCAMASASRKRVAPTPASNEFLDTAPESVSSALGLSLEENSFSALAQFSPHRRRNNSATNVSMISRWRIADNRSPASLA